MTSALQRPARVPHRPLKSHRPHSVQEGTPGMASGVSPPGPGPGSSTSEANPSPSPRQVPTHEERSWQAWWRTTASAQTPCPACLPASPGRAHGLQSSARSERAGKIRVRARGTHRGTLTGRSQHGVLCQLLTALRPVSFLTDSPRSGQVISGYGQDKGPVRGGLGATQGLLGPRRAGRRGQGSGLRRHSEHLLPGTALSPAQGHGTPTSHRSRSSTAGEGSQSKACGSCPRAPGADSGRSWE